MALRPGRDLAAHVVALDNAAQNSLALGQILKMDHATQIEVAQFSPEFVVADLQPDVSGVP